MAPSALTSGNPEGLDQPGVPPGVNMSIQYKDQSGFLAEHGVRRNFSWGSSEDQWTSAGRSDSGQGQQTGLHACRETLLQTSLSPSVGESLCFVKDTPEETHCNCRGQSLHEVENKAPWDGMVSHRIPGAGHPLTARGQGEKGSLV